MTRKRQFDFADKYTFPRGLTIEKDRETAHLMLPAPRLKSKFVARQWRVTMQRKQRQQEEFVMGKTWWAALGCEVCRQLMLGHSLSMNYHRMLVQSMARKAATMFLTWNIT